MADTDDYLRVLVRVAREAAHRELSTASASAALRDHETPGIAAWLAARALLGDGLRDYEPETIRAELTDAVPQENLDKVHAVLALIRTASFYEDYRVFGATTLALCTDHVATNLVPYPDPAQMAWAALEAELLTVLDDDTLEPEFDDEVVAYVAALLHHEGFVMAPAPLEFADGALVARLHPEATALRSEVKGVLDEVTPATALSAAAGVQVERLAFVERYVEERAQRTTKALQALR